MQSKRINVSQEEIIEAIRNICIKKFPELSDEEFEINLNYDAYYYKHTAYVDIID